MADKMGMDITERDKAVFWGTPNMLTAQAWAIANSKTTLEQTEGGKILAALELFGKNSKLTGKQAAEIWDIASKRFAQQASGNIAVFSTGAKKMNDYGNLRTWWRIEKPELIKNPNITSVTRMKIDGIPSKTGHIKK